ncbi:MAG TPA: hypothetical protein VKY74_18385, partial [Chloroflexia bacterium]|nr:hypothetical protein [Chloroflexia bacterium]
GDLSLTPYEPVTLLDTQSGGRLFALDLTATHAPFVAPVPPSEAPVSHYFPETGHTLDRALAGYWQAHGGLAQLGYPLTEAFHQVSATDGKIYLTQYLERAVLERHPENSSPYDILPSLLGVAAYHERYGAAGAPNQQPNSDNPRYFAETGHTLGGRFRAYWDAHGGLAQQGYPISDEFTEVNTLNGQPYRVQYFQRAVFEAHPENQPPFDVLLSQLGTVRAQQLGQGAP